LNIFFLGKISLFFPDALPQIGISFEILWKNNSD